MLDCDWESSGTSSRGSPRNADADSAKKAAQPAATRTGTFAMSPASARGAASAHIEAQSSPSSPAPPVKRRKLNDKASSPTIASRVDVASSSALNGTATASPVATKALSDTGPSRLAAGALGEGDDSSASVAGTSREGSNVPAASDRELAKQQRGKDKKKRKELQRALVSPRACECLPAQAEQFLQSAPPSFAYNIQGFKNRTIGIKVSAPSVDVA